MMHLVDEPGTRTIFVSTMRGALYSVSYDGKRVTEYLDINAPAWNIGVQFQGIGARLPEFRVSPAIQPARHARATASSIPTPTRRNITPKPDFTHPAPTSTHDTVLLEWTAKNPAARNLRRRRRRASSSASRTRTRNHNGGEVAFNISLRRTALNSGCSMSAPPMAAAAAIRKTCHRTWRRRSERSSASIRSAPTARTASTAFPPSIHSSGKPDTLGEIYAYGVRNPQRFSWDSKDGRMYVADIGQNIVEEISPVTIGANLGWNKWEGSYKYVSRQVDLTGPRSEAGMTWPIAEFDHTDPLFTRAAITGVYVYRENEIKQLQNLLLFGDNPSGEIFYRQRRQAAAGGQDQIRRIMFDDKGTNKTLLQLIREKNAAQGKTPAARADLRLAADRVDRSSFSTSATA